MRIGSKPALRTAFFAWIALTVLQAAAAPLLAEPALYRARAGASMLACGGFAGGCFVHELHGTLTLDVTSNAIEIVDTELFLQADTGGAFPFPDDGDLQLAGLEAPYNGHTATFEAENEFGQSAQLELVRVEVNLSDPSPVAFVLQGTYDQACCDRFVYELGNVVLERAADEQAVHLNGDGFDRFTVRVHWKETPSGPTRDAVPERTGPSSAQFWFFESDNPEIFVKLVNACETEFDAVWAFVSGLTDLGVTVVVTDSVTGMVREYENAAGQAFAAVTDTSAFSCANG